MPPMPPLFPYTTALPISYRAGGTHARPRAAGCPRRGPRRRHAARGRSRPRRRGWRARSFRGPASRAASAGSWAHHEPEAPPPRSEEHTSELQSQSNLVCRLCLHSFPTRPLFRSHTEPEERTLGHALRAAPEEARDGDTQLEGARGLDGADGALDPFGVQLREQHPPGHGLTTNRRLPRRDRKSTRLNSSHSQISYAAYASTLSLHDRSSDLIPSRRNARSATRCGLPQKRPATETRSSRALAASTARMARSILSGSSFASSIRRVMGSPRTGGSPAEIGRAHV